MENMTKQVFVVVPVYNVEAYLGKCLDSLLQQTYQSISLILIDDGSTDNSGAICDAYVNNYRNVACVHQKNKGLAGARNAGIEYAINTAGCSIGDSFIAFIDSDDSIHPEMIASLTSIIQYNDSISISGAEMATVFEGEHIDPTSVDLSRVEYVSYFDFAYRFLTHAASVSVCNKLFKLSLFQNMRFAEGRLNEDGLLLYEMVLKQKCNYGHLPQPMYYYLMRDGSITRSGFGNHITDMVGNFQRIEEITCQYAPALQKEANDNYLYGCAVFCSVVPRSYYLQNRDGVPQLIGNEIRRRRRTIDNACLKRREKLILKLYAENPMLTVTMISIYRSLKQHWK